MSDADRKRLVAILGMLGSAAAGERDNAARLAEQFRRQHGLTWAQLFEPQTVYVERVIERPAARTPTEPAPMPAASPAPQRPVAAWPKSFLRTSIVWAGPIFLFVYLWIVRLLHG